MATSIKKPLTDYTLKPVTITRNADGSLNETCMKSLNRQLDAIQSSLAVLHQTIESCESKITKVEHSSRSRYNILLHKPDKSKEEFAELTQRIEELEGYYNTIYLTQRKVREEERSMKAKFPVNLINELNNYYKEGNIVNEAV